MKKAYYQNFKLNIIEKIKYQIFIKLICIT